MIDPCRNKTILLQNYSQLIFIRFNFQLKFISSCILWFILHYWFFMLLILLHLSLRRARLDKTVKPQKPPTKNMECSKKYRWPLGQDSWAACCWDQSRAGCVRKKCSHGVESFPFYGWAIFMFNWWEFGEWNCVGQSIHVTWQNATNDQPAIEGWFESSGSSHQVIKLHNLMECFTKKWWHKFGRSFGNLWFRHIDMGSYDSRPE